MFIESIRMVNGRIMNLSFHQDRVDQTYALTYPEKKPIRLKQYLKIPASYRSGIYKVRIVYSEREVETQFHPYHMKQTSSLQLVYNDQIEYASKFLNRDALIGLYNQRNKSEDILIVKNNLITDGYYSNVALLKKDRWYTPSKPLLQGTRREQLLQQKRIVTADIRPSDLEQFSHISLFNAMIPHKKVIVPISKISF